MAERVQEMKLQEERQEVAEAAAQRRRRRWYSQPLKQSFRAPLVANKPLTQTNHSALTGSERKSHGS